MKIKGFKNNQDILFMENNKVSTDVTDGYQEKTAAYGFVQASNGLNIIDKNGELKISLEGKLSTSLNMDISTGLIF